MLLNLCFDMKFWFGLIFSRTAGSNVLLVKQGDVKCLVLTQVGLFKRLIESN